MRLMEIYAIRSRELSDALFILGRHVTTKSQIDEALKEVKKAHALVEQAGVDLFSFVESLSLTPPTQKGENLSNQCR